MAQHIFLNLVQTSRETASDWREVILMDEGATSKQVRVLLELLGERQGSHVTHPQDQSAYLRAVNHLALSPCPGYDEGASVVSLVHRGAAGEDGIDGKQYALEKRRAR